MNIRTKLFQELTLFCKEYFKTCDYFVCVYGSYASSDFTKDSDLDLFIATAKPSSVDFKTIRDFVVNLHIQNHLKIDEEVPYINKLIMSYNDVADAVRLKAFIKKGQKYLIPPVTDDKDFLMSREVRLRIILNALTSPHEYICGNQNEYSKSKQKAEKAIIRLAYGLTPKTNLNEGEILQILLRGPKGEESGTYLGYRNQRVKVIKYLKDLISRNNIY